jgi:hypothetical protein
MPVIPGAQEAEIRRTIGFEARMGKNFVRIHLGQALVSSESVIKEA